MCLTGLLLLLKRLARSVWFSLCLAWTETYKRPDKSKQAGGESMSAKDQLTLDDYILPYVDDSDSDEES